MNKRGYYFSLDALFALIIILGVVLFIKPTSVQTDRNVRIHEDFLNVLSSLKIGEMNNVYVQQLIAEGKIDNTNLTVLEQIGEFYADSKPEAQFLTDEILRQLNLDENIGLYFNGIPVSTSGSLNFDKSEEVWTSRQIISGIKQGDSIKGYSSRAFLSSKNKVDYFYFGGYVGDGNISVYLHGDVIEAIIEADFSGDFDLYINGVYAESYFPTPGVPYKINLNPHVNLFDTDNFIEFKSNESIYIAGGYLKVIYNSSQILSSLDTKYFPGIDGLINIYDGFYVPGNLTNMEISLHYSSLFNIFLTIGNKKIFQGSTNGSEETVVLSNNFLSSLLDYSSMSRKTIPFRIGLENISYYANFTKNADIFSVTDLSSSMNSNIPSLGVKMIDLAKNANRKFIEIIFENPFNRVGLVGYNTEVTPGNYHVLSDNLISLNNSINNWETKAGNCVCCGIINATISFIHQSPPEKYKFMVVMTDGSMQGTCYSGSSSATQDAIRASCEAYNNYNITVYTVGFGDNADDVTLQAMASCGNGNYYHSSIEQIIIIYSEIAKDIINATYVEQKVISQNINTVLFPDSYIFLDYQKEIPYGLMINTETDVFGNEISEGIFFVPENAEPYEIGVVSYSGSKWTDNVQIYNNITNLWEKIYSLENYNSSYVNLGDPYIVKIPVEKIVKGNNRIRVSTGLNPTNSSGGSVYDKAILSLIKDISSYSPITSKAEGCIWTIEFENNLNSTMVIPSNYLGTQRCYYTEDNIAYDNNDAIDYAIYILLQSLDLNLNRKIEVKFEESDLTINSVEVQGIPFPWETEVQVRVWI